MEGNDLSALSGEELQQEVEEIVQQRVQAELKANRINEGEVTYAPPPAGNPVPPTGSQPSPSSQGKTPSFNDPSSVAHIVAQAAKATAEAIAEQQGFARSGTLRDLYIMFDIFRVGGHPGVKTGVTQQLAAKIVTERKKILTCSTTNPADFAATTGPSFTPTSSVVSSSNCGARVRERAPRNAARAVEAAVAAVAREEVDRRRGPAAVAGDG
ncbi:unnamed protein product [Ectocarpus sp. CCAP 1310/34]|nr:unnamed protein product [Ectocarpus sp. CCAP 1310/34]